MTGTLKITGKLTKGSTLTASLGTLADNNGIINPTYEWFGKSANGTVTSLSTNPSYILTAADLKTDVFVKVSYVDTTGAPKSSTESHIFNHAHTGTIAINGAATVGNVLSITNTLKDSDVINTPFTYTWTDYDPATNITTTVGNKSTYKVTSSDHILSVSVSYTDKLGYLESETKSTAAVTVSTKTSSANDVLTSTMSLDKLTGGLGSDTFVFVNAITSGLTDTTRDVITDFNHSQKDKIDLSKIDADALTVGNNAFVSLANVAPSSNATGVLWFDADTSILYGSTDADVDPEFSIQLTGTAVLEQSDIIL